jgi:hypothetical protein
VEASKVYKGINLPLIEKNISYLVFSEIFTLMPQTMCGSFKSLQRNKLAFD